MSTATGASSRTEPDGSVVMLMDRYDGNRLNSPNIHLAKSTCDLELSHSEQESIMLPRTVAPFLATGTI